MCAREVGKGAVLGSVGRGGWEGGRVVHAHTRSCFDAPSSALIEADGGGGAEALWRVGCAKSMELASCATLSLERAAEAVHIVAPYFWLHCVAAQMRAVKVEESAGSAAPRTWRSKSPSPRRPLTRGARLLLELRRPPRGLKW